MSEDALRDCESVHGYVSRICFKKGPPTRVGAELEFLLAGADPRDHVALPHVRAAVQQATPFPCDSSVTFEPGGQVELSSPPATSLTALVSGLHADVEHLVSVLADAGLRVLDVAVDPCRTPRRQLVSRRYDGMEAYFDELEPGTDPADRVGRSMMTTTAATQVNLDAGTDVAARWQLLHDLGPVLVAAFANSPLRAGRLTGWKSTRQRIWQALDPSRTAPPPDGDPVSAYSELALDAPVMLERHRGTLRDWVLSDDPPHVADLDLHLSTLFPPVRPRGWFEVRYVDAQPLAWWPVPVAVLSSLLDDPVAAGEAGEAAAPARGRWRSAAQVGLADPVLQEAASSCLRIATESLERHDPLLVDIVARFREQYTDRGRCPADDRISSSSSDREVGVQ
ncbi:MAG TPA: ergothioneine biosynthesis glutamate--cysteine ligase EgtA [Nocardioidaceae bacterium]|nr:ergothioneine biosynthesis glutamate--cysteine ligase EgtA [Nocardioidaceae bacterium]